MFSLFNHKQRMLMKTFDSFSKSSRLDLTFFEMRMMEYAMIEEKARCYLNSVNVNYDKLDKKNCWTVLIGAGLALEYVYIFASARNIEEGMEGFTVQFKGFIENAMPYYTHAEIDIELRNLLKRNNSKDLQNDLIEKCNFSKFEAKIKMLSIAVSSMICENVENLKKIEEALYSFYLEASDNYFIGKIE